MEATVVPESITAAPPRPLPKPPFVPPRDDGGYPIANITRMRAGPWSLTFTARVLFQCGRADCAETCGTLCYAATYPQRAEQALRGIIHGVDIGYTGDRSTARSSRNLKSALELPHVSAMIDEIIRADVTNGTKAGPFDTPPSGDAFSFSPIGAVPKGGSWEKIRVIHHLSYPFGGDSINNSISDDILQLGRFDHACDAIRRLGRGCFLIKLDVEAAYKQVPVKRADRALLGLQWRGKFYYELALPFGLKSSGARWELFAAALHWFFEHLLGITLVIHYVDDFLFVVPNSIIGAQQLAAALELCSKLGVPMADKKTEGPTTSLTFLGIELDTIAMTARLSVARLAELKALLQSWMGRTTCKLVEMQSLVGKLQFACQVVRPGRAYTRRLIGQCTTMAAEPRQGQQHDLTREARADIKWWRRFIEEWNGISLLYEVEWTQATKLHLSTDACGTGYGAAFGNEWVQGNWSKSVLTRATRASALSMPYLELRALVIAALAWGERWGGKKIIFECDCQPVVYATRTMSSKNSDIQGLLRLLSATAAKHGFDFRTVHIAGVTNIVADALSRGCSRQELLAVLPGAADKATPFKRIPEAREL